MSKTKAVVALSGGQDSATCLYWAVDTYGAENVAALHLQYGQRHAIEGDCASWLALDALNRPPAQLDLGHFIGDIAPSGLLDHGMDLKADAGGTGNDYAAARGLPSSFVPGRNVFLLGAAAAWGLVRGCTDLVSGVCEEDDAGYPDCRADFIAELTATLRTGMDCDRFTIVTPLMARSKAATWRLAEQLGVVDKIVNHTHTCYAGDHDHLHDWGYGCGECPACETRAAGWAEFLA